MHEATHIGLQRKWVVPTQLPKYEKVDLHMLCPQVLQHLHLAVLWGSRKTESFKVSVICNELTYNGAQCRLHMAELH